MRLLRKRLEDQCPWSRSTIKNLLRCKSFEPCSATFKEQSCCQTRGGILQCPENFPLMCQDGTCDVKRGMCTERGGIKECAAAEACPWILPTVLEMYALCQDGNHSAGVVTPTDSRCQDHGGVQRCPWSRPVMCAEPTCKGDYCCQTDCAEKGGPRHCETEEGMSPAFSASSQSLKKLARSSRIPSEEQSEEQPEEDPDQ